MQIVGLVIPPLAILLELNGDLGQYHGVSKMLMMLIAAVCLFYIGRIVEGHAGK